MLKLIPANDVPTIGHKSNEDILEDILAHTIQMADRLGRNFVTIDGCISPLACDKLEGLGYRLIGRGCNRCKIIWRE